MSFTVDKAKRELMNQKTERKTLRRMQHRETVFNLWMENSKRKN